MKDVIIKELQEQIFYGLRTISNDKQIKKNTQDLMQQVHRASGCEMKPPYIICTKEFYQDDGEYQLFVGGMKRYQNLEKLMMLEGTYAVIEVSCKWMQSWYTAIHEAKHYIYHKWVDKTPYVPCHVEYVLFTEKSLEKKPILELYVKLMSNQKAENS